MLCARARNRLRPDSADPRRWPAYARSDLALADALPDSVAVPDTVSGDLLRCLSAYAILSRYPGDLEDVAEADYEEALEIASRVVDWAGLQLGSGRPEP